VLLGLAAILSGLGGSTVAHAASTAYRDEVLADSPVSYWRLSEAPGASTAVDQQTRNPGIYLGGATLGQPGAIASDPSNFSATFDGVNDYVNVPDSNSLDMTAGVTEEAWVKRSKSSVLQAILGKAADGQSKFENYSLWLNRSNKAEAHFGNGGPKYASVVSSVALDTNWHYLVVTYDNASVKLYLDGQLNASSSSSIQLTPNSDPLYIGRSTGTNAFFGGQIDEVAVYSTVVSAARIQAHYAKAFADVTAPVVTLTAPAGGSSLGTSTPTFSGAAGTAPGDSNTVAVKIYAGTTASGTPVQTLMAAVAAGAYSAAAIAPLPDGTYTARAEQADQSGNIGLSDLSTFAVDTAAPPTPTIDSGPTSPSGPTVTFRFSDTEAGVAFRCRLDDGAFAPCTSPTSYSGLVQASHTFSVAAVDRAGNQGGAATWTWSVDAPPAVTLVTPSNGSATNRSTPTFAGGAGTAPDDSTAVTVKIYSGSAVGGAPVQTLSAVAVAGGWSVDAASPLADGAYTAQAEQSDVGGNTGVSAPSTFTVDTTGPAAAIVSSPNDPSNSSSPSFGFTASEPGSSFECSLDGGSFAACTSPKSYSGLADGLHTFSVRARDALGNPGSSVSYSWTIDTVPPAVPTIASGPSDPSGSSSATFTFSSSDSGASLVCSLDAATFAACTSPATFSGLVDGAHTFRVQAVDAAGNRSTPATATWTIDTTAPVVTLATPANGSSTVSTTPTFSGSAGMASGDAATVTVKVYSGSSATGIPVETLAAAVSGSSYAVVASPSLLLGTYTAQTEQSDTLGHVGRSSANTFTIVPAGSGSPYRDAVMADGPRGYWRLGESSGTTAADETGANLGTYTNGVTLGQPGVIPTDPNTSASFDGVNDYVKVNDSNSLDLASAVTIEAWVKRSRSGTWQVIVGKPGNGQSALENYALWLNTLNQPVAYFGNGSTFMSVAAPALDTNWHYLVASYDNSVARIFVDGALSLAKPSTVQMAANTQPLNIGRSNSNGSFFGGLIDEVAVYPTVLSPQRILARYNLAVDTLPPKVTLTAPAHGSSTTNASPTFAGTAGTASGDPSTVTVRVFSGLDAVGTPVQTLTATRQGDGSYAVDAAALSAGTYTAQASEGDVAGNIGYSSANSFGVNAPAPSVDRSLLAAGDIADCNSPGDEATAALLANFPNANVATLGDNVYPNGTSTEFSNCYNPSWGAAKSRTRPTLGEHDYGTSGAAGYMGYFQSQLAPFGASATDPVRGYYSYDLGAWHIAVVNSPCKTVAPGCDVNSQVKWLRADLASHPTKCSLVMWADPRFSSGSVHGNNPDEGGYWAAAYDWGAEVVLNGQDHLYERFARQDADGNADPQNGVREFIVGTGGEEEYTFTTTQPNSEVRQTGAWGIIKLTLHPASYDWQFVPQAGKSFTDSGSEACH